MKGLMSEPLLCLLAISDVSNLADETDWLSRSVGYDRGDQQNPHAVPVGMNEALL
jgi:hypothetical protein